MDVAVIEWMETALTAPGLTVLLVSPKPWRSIMWSNGSASSIGCIETLVRFVKRCGSNGTSSWLDVLGLRI